MLQYLFSWVTCRNEKCECGKLIDSKKDEIYNAILRKNLTDKQKKFIEEHRIEICG